MFGWYTADFLLAQSYRKSHPANPLLNMKKPYTIVRGV